MPTLVLFIGIAVAVKNRNKFFWYQLILLSAFLISLTLSGSLDNTLPVYAIAALLPCFLRCREYGSVCIVFCFAMMGYLLVGLFQSPFSAAATFLSRICQFFGLLFALGADGFSEPSPRSCMGALYFGLAIECILAVYLAFNSTAAGGGEVEGFRLVANSQPITGNLAIALLPLVGYLFFQRYKHDAAQRFRVFIIASFFLFLTVLSGTRGYVLLYGCCYAVMAWFYMWDAATGAVKSHLPYLVFCAVAVAALVLFAAYQRELFQMIASVLRINDNLGIRDYENLVVIQTYEGLPLLNKVMGIGIGGRWADYSSFINAIWSIFPEWAREAYLPSAGTAVHNYYGNIIVLTGAFGTTLFALVALWLLRRIVRLRPCAAHIKLFLVVYVLGYLLQLYFRWPADCGIGTLIIFGYVLRLLEQRFDSTKESTSLDTQTS